VFIVVIKMEKSTRGGMLGWERDTLTGSWI
jgi:hypothetical protein